MIVRIKWRPPKEEFVASAWERLLFQEVPPWAPNTPPELHLLQDGKAVAPREPSLQSKLLDLIADATACEVEVREGTLGLGSFQIAVNWWGAQKEPLAEMWMVFNDTGGLLSEFVLDSTQMMPPGV